MKKKLNKETIIKELFQYGYLNEAIPDCFNSNDFALNYTKLMNDVRKVIRTSSCTIDIYKNEAERRTISLPNPYAFTHTVKFIKNNFSKIRENAESENSQSPIVRIHGYDNDVYSINSGGFLRSLKRNSKFTHNLMERIKYSLGYKYLLKVDIANFYETIYTHSLAWAVCGKEESKQMCYNSIAKSDLYIFADNFDKSMRNQSANETNGIITGPFTSRIFSEIILSKIDEQLRQKNLHFKRYVDDYRFYFRDKNEAMCSLTNISNIFAEFKLKINNSKVEILCYPFELDHSVPMKLQQAFKNFGAYGLLVEAGELWNQGIKSSYKYSFKILQDKELPKEDFSILLSLLFNIQLLDPSYSIYICNIISTNINYLDLGQIEENVNCLLAQCLNKEFNHEALNFLFLAKEFDINIETSNIYKSLKTNNDFITIIALDIWKNHKSKVIEDNLTEYSEIEQQINFLTERMTKESVDGEHWLLLYQSKLLNLLNITEFNGSTEKFFNHMLDLNISFYR